MAYAVFGGLHFRTCQANPRKIEWCQSVPAWQTDPHEFEAEIIGLEVYEGRLWAILSNRKCYTRAGWNAWNVYNVDSGHYIYKAYFT